MVYDQIFKDSDNVHPLPPGALKLSTVLQLPYNPMTKLATNKLIEHMKQKLP